MGFGGDFSSSAIVDVNYDELSHLISGYARSCRVYCKMTVGNAQVACYVGEGAEKDFVEQFLDASYARMVSDSFVDDLDENVVELTSQLPFVLSGGVAIRREGKVKGTIAVIGIDEAKCDDPLLIPSEVAVISAKDFANSIAFLESFAKSLYNKQVSNAELKRKIAATTVTEGELSSRLVRGEVMTRILSQMESDDTFSKVAENILSDAASYLGADGACVIKRDGETDNCEIITEWVREASFSIIPSFVNIKVSDLPFMNGKSYTISSDIMTPQEFVGLFARFSMRAAIFYPLSVGTKSSMYMCLYVMEDNRRWSVEDLRFANDVKRVLSTILVKRVTRNSLASSYSALETIIEKCHCGYMVCDKEKRSILYQNSSMKKMFESEKDLEGLLDLAYDNSRDMDDINSFYADDVNRWFDLSFSEMQWVDGRSAMLIASYDISDIKSYQWRLEQQTYMDYLTCLYNRKKYELDLDKELRHCLSSSDEAALLIIDLDDFNNINDGLGHEQGDELLRDIAASINAIPVIHSHCYRVGGDEFAVIVDHENVAKMEYIIKRIAGMFTKPWKLGSKEYYCTMSMGVASIPKDGCDMTSLLKAVDLALKDAKKLGKNRVEYYNRSNEDYTTRRLDLEKQMRQAVENGCNEFEIYYQPLMAVSANEEKCCGAEALVRWKSPVFGFVYPDEFIPLAEYLGLIVPIGRHVLLEACRMCKYWNDFGHPEYKVNVNLSVVQLMQTDIVEQIGSAINTTGIDPHNLTLEVTESLAINDLDRMSFILMQIKSLGCRIALDDFGTGYSSLNHIRSMPIDTIKIDKCFIKDIGKDNFSDAFVHAVSELAGSLAMDVCVEGVEGADQKTTLGSMDGVNIIQGYYYDKPLTSVDFEKKYLI